MQRELNKILAVKTHILGAMLRRVASFQDGGVCDWSNNASTGHSGNSEEKQNLQQPNSPSGILSCPRDFIAFFYSISSGKPLGNEVLIETLA